MRVLLVEDDPELAAIVESGLREHSFEVVRESSADAGRSRALLGAFDVIILDVMLPGGNGFDLCRTLRGRGVGTPVLMLTARDTVDDRVHGLDAGADDYLTKPFGVAELLARVRVVLRHLAATKGDTGEPVFTVGSLRVDLARREVIVDGRAVHLTRNEFKLLAVLVKNAGRVLTHRYLLREVWGPSADEETHYLRVYMNQLRQKLEPDGTRPRYLLTEPGVGYRLAAE